MGATASSEELDASRLEFEVLEDQLVFYQSLGYSAEDLNRLNKLFTVMDESTFVLFLHHHGLTKMHQINQMMWKNQNSCPSLAYLDRHLRVEHSRYV